MTNATTANAAETIAVLKETVWGLLLTASTGALTSHRAEVFMEKLEAVMDKEEELIVVANDLNNTLDLIFQHDLPLRS